MMAIFFSTDKSWGLYPIFLVKDLLTIFLPRKAEVRGQKVCTLEHQSNRTEQGFKKPTTAVIAVTSI